MSAKYGVRRNGLREWIVRQGWTKQAVLRSYEDTAGQSQLQRDLCTAIKSAENRKIVQSLEQSLLLPVATKRSAKLAIWATWPGRCG